MAHFFVGFFGFFVEPVPKLAEVARSPHVNFSVFKEGHRVVV
jgi:hypothetical protein